MSKYKKIAKSMLTESAWDRKFGEPLPTLEDVMKEAESMSLQPKGGGKTVVFKNKDNYDKAKKSGDYEEPEETDDGGEKEEPSSKFGAGDFDRKSFTGPQGDKPDGMYGEPDDEEPSDKPSGDKTKKTGFLSKNKPQKAKDLANDPSADTGPDSRGTEWSGDYFGADDSAEWQDDYEEAEEDEDEEKLAQIRWFGEKQGWGENGEIGGKSARTGKELDKNETLKIDGKMYKKVQEQKETTTGKHPLRETYEKIGGM